MIDKPKTYDLDSIPADAETGSRKDFSPLDPIRFYQVEVVKAELRDNPYYDEKETDPAKKGSKYQIGFEFAILDEGEFYGRRLWKNTSLSFFPSTRKGEPTVLYKIINAALDTQMDWDSCTSFAPDAKTLMGNIADKVIGKQLVVSIENITNPDTKKVRSSIKSYNPIKTELAGFDSEKSKAMGEAKGIEVEEQVTTGNASLDDLDLDNIAAELDKEEAAPKKKK